MTELFDIVFFVGNNDIDAFQENLKFNKENIIGYRNIYIVSPVEIIIDKCYYINDNKFPFSINDIEDLIENKSRKNWILQQLLKLYSLFVIPGVLDKILVIDSDTKFLKPTTFIDNDGLILLNYGTEYHQKYFDHANKLHPSIVKYDSKKSGIVHHCLFDKFILQELFKLVEEYHNETFWKVFLNSIEKDENLVSSCSEFEIYFNYCLIYHQDKVKIRYLLFNDIFDTSIDKNDDFVYFSKHTWYYK